MWNLFLLGIISSETVAIAFSHAHFQDRLIGKTNVWSMSLIYARLFKIPLFLHTNVKEQYLCTASQEKMFNRNIVFYFINQIWIDYVLRCDAFTNFEIHLRNFDEINLCKRVATLFLKMLNCRRYVRNRRASYGKRITMRKRNYFFLQIEMK